MPAEIKKKRPRRRRWRRFDDGEISRGTYIVPNLFTTANLFSGFFGIVNSINGKYELAAIAIFASCIFDILDGKVARYTGGTSRFGVEYDSLADLVSFGVGPGLLMYLWALTPYGRLGWLAAFVVVACGALRLARFNVQVDTGNKKYFVGLPIPGAALVVASTVLFLHDLQVVGSFSVITLALLLLTYLLGFFMVSTIPYNSFKDFEMVQGRRLHILFVVIMILTIIAISPGLVLFLLLMAYLSHGPINYIRLRRSRAMQGTSAASPPPPPQNDEVLIVDDVLVERPFPEEDRPRR